MRYLHNATSKSKMEPLHPFSAQMHSRAMFQRWMKKRSIRTALPTAIRTGTLPTSQIRK
jgi:hypothetical protein